MVKMKLSKVSGLLFLNIGLWSIVENKYRDMAILLDTGASFTTISEQILNSLGYTDPGSKVVVTTASGSINVRTKTIDKVRIGSIELDNVHVYSHSFPDKCFSDGVLGMNILNLFNFKVDLDSLVLEIEKRNNT